MPTPHAPPPRPQSAPSPPPQAPPRAAGRWGLALLAAVLVAHTWEATRLFPSLGSILDPGSPVVNVDHAIHEYHGALGAGFLRADGRTWGYDPFFMAGYPETPVWDSSSNAAIAFNLLGGPGGSFRAYKVGLFALSVLGPVAVAAGARAAGLGWVAAALAAALASFYFWAGYPINLWRSGLFAFLSAAIGSALLLGLCVRFHDRPTRPGWLALTATAAGLFFLHVTTPIVVGGGALAFYLVVARRHGRRWHLAIGAAVAATVALNLIWLVPLWQFRGLRVGGGSFLTTDSARFLLDYYLSPNFEPGTGRPLMVADPRTGVVLGLLGSAGLLGWWLGGRRPAAAAFGGSIAVLVLLTGFGSLWGPTRVLEPLRFRVAFAYLLAVPAASALAGGSGWIFRRARWGWPAGAAVALAWVAGLALLGWSSPNYFREVGFWLAMRRPLVVGYPPEAYPLVAWIKRETDPSARILFEDQLRLHEGTDAESTHWTPLLPTLLAPDARMFVGGLYQTAFIQHHELAAFGDFRLGDRPIDEWTPAEIAAYADRYNVGWVACWSPLSRFVFDRLPGVTRVGTIPRHATPGRPPANNAHERTAIIRRGGMATARKYILEGESTYAVYRLDRPHSYFLRGRGRVVAVAPDRVELADVEPDAEGVAVLSLHWIDGWRADPPATLKPEPVPPDPVPFVRIESDRPIPRLVLRVGRGG